MIKIDGSYRIHNKVYTSPAIVIELDLEARAGGSAGGGDPRFTLPDGSLPPDLPGIFPPIGPLPSRG